MGYWSCSHLHHPDGRRCGRRQQTSDERRQRRGASFERGQLGQDAIDETRRKVQDKGEAAMKNEKCAKPCERHIYVEISIDNIVPRWSPGKKGKEPRVPISGSWKAGILCFNPG